MFNRRRCSPLLSSLVFLCLLTSTALAQAPFNPNYNETWNRNYFGFPALINWIPVFSVGDTINASWSDDYVGLSRVINVWCGADAIVLIQTFNGLEQNGNQLFEVLQSWKDPCHLEFQVSRANGDRIGGFNSGAFNINNSPRQGATPTTWGATGPSGSVETYTGGTLTPTATAAEETQSTRSISSAVPTTSPDSAMCTAAGADSGFSTSNSNNGPHLSFGAGIGVGVAISFGALAIVALGSLLLRHQKRRRKTYTSNVQPGMEKYGGQMSSHHTQQPPVEVGAEAARVEMPAERYG